MLKLKGNIGRDGFEKNKSENIKTSKYNWPYSQPRIFNVIRASSRIGIIIGFVSCYFMINDAYYFSIFPAIDFIFVIALLLYRFLMIPMVRRGKIKNVASERILIKKIILVAIFIFFYSSLIRFLIAVSLYTKSVGPDGLHFLLSFYSNTLKNMVSSTHFIPVIIISILPYIMFIYPKKVNVIAHHNRFITIKKEERQRVAMQYEEETSQYESYLKSNKGPTGLPKYSKVEKSNKSKINKKHEEKKIIRPTQNINSFSNNKNKRIEISPEPELKNNYKNVNRKARNKK